VYFPPYSQILQSVKIEQRRSNDDELVIINKKLFDLLIQAGLASCEFNEAEYLRMNPDVADGPIRNGQMTARQHFVGYGYFENRRGILPDVDEEWYRNSYKDVAQEIENGGIPSAKEHFETTGAGEGRSPSRGHLPIAEMWKKALKQK